jgi:hypothetical protein
MGSLKRAVAHIGGLLLADAILATVGRPGVWLAIGLTAAIVILIIVLALTGTFSSNDKVSLNARCVLAILLGHDMPAVPPPMQEEGAPPPLQPIPRPRHSADRAQGISSTLDRDAPSLDCHQPGGADGMVSRSEEVGSEDRPAVLWS